MSESTHERHKSTRGGERGSARRGSRGSDSHKRRGSRSGLSGDWRLRDDSPSQSNPDTSSLPAWKESKDWRDRPHTPSRSNTLGSIDERHGAGSPLKDKADLKRPESPWLASENWREASPRPLPFRRGGDSRASSISSDRRNTSSSSPAPLVDPAFLGADWHDEPIPEMLKHRHYVPSSSPINLTPASEIREGMLIWAVNPEFESYSDFFGHGLSKDRQGSADVIKHFELVLSVHGPSREHPRPHVRTIMARTFGSATSLQSKRIPKEKWKYCVPIYPAQKESEDSGQEGPVVFQSALEEKPSWFLVHRMGIIEADKDNMFEVVTTNIDKETLDGLHYLTTENEKTLRSKKKPRKKPHDKDPLKLQSWRH